MSLPLECKQVLITGVGLRRLETRFCNAQGQLSHTLIEDGTDMYKANIGAACALACAEQGATVHMVARTTASLQIIQRWIINETGQQVEYTPTDVTDSASLEKLVQGLPDDSPLHWVQSVGIGAGTVKLPDNNPYLLIEEITPQLLEAELSVIQSTVTLMQLLLARFRQQGGARICIISSMSAIRSFRSGSAHMAAKGALSRWTNAAMIELAPENIYITDVRPGGVDTGLYDPPAVQDRVAKICATYGYDWSRKAGGPKLISPLEVGKAVAFILSLDCHVPSINMVGAGQMPHEGS